MPEQRGGGCTMKHRNQKAVSREVIAELMLAKTVLEEKNEIIDQKDRIIRELYSKEKDLELELATFKNEIESAKGMLRRYVDLNKTEHGKILQSGTQKVIADVVAITADYADSLPAVTGRGPEIDGSLAARLIDLFVEKYDLEVLDGVPEAIDPKIHQVIEVSEDPCAEPALVQLSKGYKIGRKVIRPLRLKACRQADATLRFYSPRISIWPGGCSDPDEVA
jgi:molecular chaperone GrpE (heat shock protein)